MTGRGLRYRATLWNGRVSYRGLRCYERPEDAVRAAESTGATARNLQDAESK